MTDTIKVYNESRDRTAIETDGGVTYRVDPQQVTELPATVAHRMISEWPSLRIIAESKVRSTDVWEARMGKAWDAVKREFNIDLDAKREVVGPETPPVEEPPMPADAVDPETGRVIDKNTNTHLCTYCQKEYKTLGPLRAHMKRDHNV